MVKKGFPTFGSQQSGTLVSELKSYNMPDFILKIVAQECNSELLEKGRINDRLQSMNDKALAMLHKVFVDCENDDKGRFANLRYFAYISSMYHKCEILINEVIPGKSGKNHKMQIAVRSNGMYIAVAQNKAVGNPINIREIDKFHNIITDLKNGDHGTQLAEAILGSSVGFSKEALLAVTNFNDEGSKDLEHRTMFKVASFENNIYSLIKS